MSPSSAMNISKIRKLVDSQAEDEGLWFDAETASEAYLQQELRRLHAVIEVCLRNAREESKVHII